MTALNVANNNLGELVLPEGWTRGQTESNGIGYIRSDGREQMNPPAGSKAEGIIALANAIPDMEAMMSLNLASNNLGIAPEGAKIMAAVLPKCT